MFVGIGTVINVIAIIAGAAIGILAGNRIPERTRTLMTDVLGAITLIGAASAIMSLWDAKLVDSVPQGFPLLIVLGSLLIGGLIGSFLRIESRLEAWGERLKKRFDRNGNSPFVEGFVTASLIFVIGPLAILGKIGRAHV